MCFNVLLLMLINVWCCRKWILSLFLERVPSPDNLVFANASVISSEFKPFEIGAKGYAYLYMIILFVNSDGK